MKKLFPSLKYPARCLRGFSLVEVTMALGIIGFSFLTLIGLLQTGLTTFRGSLDRTISAQIGQRILNEKQQTDFADLVDTTKNPATAYRYFSDEGDEVSANNAIYVVRVDTFPNVSVPGPSSGRFTNRSMAQVRVRIVNQPGGNPPVAVWDNAGLVREMNAYIPRT